MNAARGRRAGPVHDETAPLYSSLLAQRLAERVGFPVDARVLNGAPVSFLYHVLRGQRFMNLLVHQYPEVDDPRVYEFLRTDVGDLDRFIAGVLGGCVT